MKHQAQSQSTSTSTIPKLKPAAVHKLAGLMLAIGVAAAAASTIFTSVPVWAQSEVAQPTAQAASIPKLIRYSGTLVDGRGWPITTPVSVTFAIYAQPSGDEQPALWQETQQISPNNRGSYIALLGEVNPAVPNLQKLDPQDQPADLAAWSIPHYACQLNRSRATIVRQNPTLRYFH